MMKTYWSVFMRRIKTPLQDYTTIAIFRVSEHLEDVFFLDFLHFLPCAQSASTIMLHLTDFYKAPLLLRPML